GGAQRTTLAVVENTPHRRAIPEHNLARLVLNSRVPSRDQAAGARCTSRSRSRCRWGIKLLVRSWRTLMWIGPLRYRTLTRSRQLATFEGTQLRHLTAHLDRRGTVEGEYRLGHSAQKVIVAVAMRHAHKLVGNGRDEGVLLV